MDDKTMSFAMDKLEFLGKMKREAMEGPVSQLVEKAIGEAEDASDPGRRHDAGKGLRHEVPRASHAGWTPAHDRTSPVDLLVEQGKTRVPDLLPIRYERMAASAFTFYRGAAVVMASDLARTPSTGLMVQACGDAHISNFGVFMSPERRQIFDINDFDETFEGPWEWDVKRLVTSIEICGRDRGFSSEERLEAVLGTVGSYRDAMRRFAEKGNFEVWYAHLDVERAIQEMEPRRSGSIGQGSLRGLEKARGRDSHAAARRLTEVVGGKLRVVSDPPTVVPLRDLAADVDPIAVAGALVRFFVRYRKTLSPDRRNLLSQYRVVDVARKVVGVGSVGTRAWVVVLVGRDNDDPLILQVKEAEHSVLEQFCSTVPSIDNQGKRVVEGQRAIQCASDVLLGWADSLGLDGHMHDYYVRQLWDGKGSIDLEAISPARLCAVGKMAAWTLARAHARTGDRFAIAGYLGKGRAFDDAIATFSSAYADQNEKDYQDFVMARTAGKLG